MKTYRIHGARLSHKAIILAAAAIIPQAAFAEDDAAAAAPGAEGEEIVVDGTRPIAESEAAALRIQREADNLVSVLSADSVGRLPDQNIAQAVGRLPGLAVERDQGQARYISIRGAPNYWTTLSFDGINVVSPEGRDARFDSIPSAIAAQIIVSKAITPDMPGETVAGNVNIITRSAFDYPGFRAFGKAGGGVVELGDRREYEGNLVLSNRFNAGGLGEIGVLVSGTYYERNMVTDNFETDFERVTRDQRQGNEARFWGRETENKLYRLTRKNWSVSGRLDWRPDDDNQISLRSVYTIFTDFEARDNYIFDLDDRESDLSNAATPCTITPNSTPTTTGYGDICIGNTTLRGTVYGIDINQRSTLRDFAQSVFTNTIEGKHTFGDSGLRLEWLGNYTRSKDDRSVTGEARWNSPGTRTDRPTVAYDFTDPLLHRVQLFRTVQLASPTRFQAGAAVTDVDSFVKPLAQFRVADLVDDTDAYTARAILAYDTNAFGAEATFKAGVQYDQRTKTSVNLEILRTAAADYTTIGIPTNFNQFALDIPFQGKIPLGYTFRYFDIAAMEAASAAARANFTFTPVSSGADDYRVRERVLAGFVMGTLRYDWGSIVGGVRAERVENRGVATGLTAESADTFFFPSLHLNYNVSPNGKFRIGYTTGAARADYDQLRPNVQIDDTNERISGGNPAVRPERSWGLDSYLEWYIVPQGFMSIGAFYRDVRDVLYTDRRTFGSNALNFGGIDRSDYIFSGIANAGEGRIYGVEMAAQLQLEPFTEDMGLPAWMGGFGITANLTLNNSEATKPAFLSNTGAVIVPERTVRLPGTSDTVYNIGGYYEKYGFSARLQYQRRSAWLDGIANDLTDAGDTYWAADEELDFSMRYAITRNFEVYFDASNLTDQPGRRFAEPGSILTATGTPTPFTETTTIEWERFGRRFTGGVRVTF